MSRHQIQVETQSAYLPEQSQPASDRYVFAYTITLTNTGDIAARLLARHWIITDAGEDVQEVRGLGVVGQHPHLSPGESFTYTSGAVLATPAGQMEGSYQMVGDDGVEFDAMVPPFGLVRRESLH